MFKYELYKHYQTERFNLLNKETTLFTIWPFESFDCDFIPIYRFKAVEQWLKNLHNSMYTQFLKFWYNHVFNFKSKHKLPLEEAWQQYPITTPINIILHKVNGGPLQGWPWGRARGAAAQGIIFLGAPKLLFLLSS